MQGIYTHFYILHVENDFQGVSWQLHRCVVSTHLVCIQYLQDAEAVSILHLHMFHLLLVLSTHMCSEYAWDLLKPAVHHLSAQIALGKNLSFMWQWIDKIWFSEIFNCRFRHVITGFFIKKWKLEIKTFSESK